MDESQQWAQIARLDRQIESDRLAFRDQKRPCTRPGASAPVVRSPLLSRGPSARPCVPPVVAAGRGGVQRATSLAHASAPLARGNATGGAAAGVHARKRAERQEASQRMLPPGERGRCQSAVTTNRGDCSLAVSHVECIGDARRLHCSRWRRGRCKRRTRADAEPGTAHATPPEKLPSSLDGHDYMQACPQLGV